MLRTRLDRARTRDDARDWVQNRRARTRHLIELGGLVQKAGLVELVDDDRATLLGALLELAGKLQGQHQDGEHHEAKPAELKARWRRRGLRAFEADANAMASAATTASSANQSGTAMRDGNQQAGIRENAQPGRMSRQTGSAESDR